MRTIAVAVPATLTGLVIGALALAQPPGEPAARVTAPEPRWTPSSEAPAGILSHALEGERHDFFIELAQQGAIELVFFGTTEAEM